MSEKEKSSFLNSDAADRMPIAKAYVLKEKKKQTDSKSDGPAFAGPFFVGGKKRKTSKIKAKKGRKKQKNKRKIKFKKEPQA
ncbi:MAG: hypothetical protein ACLU71_13885 [Blautia hansenii]